MAEDHLELAKKVAQAMGVELKNPNVLEEALTHRSFVNESAQENLKDNERFEFLGDAVLQLAVSDYLMKHHPDRSEGTLSKYRSSTVNERSLAQAARAMDLGRFLKLGKGEELTQGRKKDSILANAFEAVVAAVYLSDGLELATKFVNHFLAQSLSTVSARSERHDYKTVLQELTQRKLKKTPVYRLVLEEGPDHEKFFESEVLVGDKIYGRGRARSKKDSEQLGAEEAYSALKIELEGSEAKE